MAKKKKEQKAEQPEVKLESPEVEQEAEQEAEQDVKPQEYPASLDPVDPYLLRWKDKVLSHDETSYIRSTLAHWLYTSKGIDKRPLDLSQQDLEAAMQDGKFAKKVQPWLK